MVWPCGSRRPGGNTLAFDAGARVQIPDAALSILTQANVLFWSVKCVATIEQWETAVEYCGYKLLPGVTLPLRV